MSIVQPDFSKLNEIDEQLLLAKLEAARAAIAHSGEKGRTLEGEVSALLRSFLPSEYGLSTGFVAYHGKGRVKLSSQLDVIIYDALRSGPIVRLATCDVFPLEAVYGYIEVKATIQSTSDDAEEYADNSIEKCLLQNKEIRSMEIRKYWTPGERSTLSRLRADKWMQIRSYVFAFEPQGEVAKDPEAFAKRMSNFGKRLGQPTHMHGVFIAGQGFYRHYPVAPEDPKEKENLYRVDYTTEQPFAYFKWSLIHALSRFPRYPEHWTPAIEKYYEERGKWKNCYPE